MNMFKRGSKAFYKVYILFPAIIYKKGQKKQTPYICVLRSAFVFFVAWYKPHEYYTNSKAFVRIICLVLSVCIHCL